MKNSNWKFYSLMAILVALATIGILQRTPPEKLFINPTQPIVRISGREGEELIIKLQQTTPWSFKKTDLGAELKIGERLILVGSSETVCVTNEIVPEAIKGNATHYLPGELACFGTDSADKAN